jgi:tetratricopeptide (TPR) repeat protein
MFLVMVASMGVDGMDCPSVDTIQSFLGGALGTAERSGVLDHLLGCPGCRADVGVASKLARAPDDLAQARSDLGADLELGAGAARERVGRFEVHEPLGLGGMGTVFRALDPAAGEWVALKRVRMDDPALIEALRREIHALRRIDHPGVVRVLDEDAGRGMPWYAMELLEGKMLAEHIAALRASLSPEPRFAEFQPLLAVFRLLCETLAFLHGEGVVHRDLTPRNVIIRPDGTPTLVDFGLATQFPAPGREALDLHRPRAGTPDYLAPEQRVRNVVDARADLYALGCILYQLFTGLLPATTAQPTETTQRRIDRRAPAPEATPPLRRPSDVVGDIPRALDEVIMRMLAADPRARVGYATDVARALDAASVAPPPPWWRRPVRSYVYRPAMFGRDLPLARLGALVDRGMAGRGGLALVGGESGVGKTRLVLELASIARDRHLAVITGACANVSADGRGPSGAPDALHLFQPLVQAILDHCRHGGPDEARDILGKEAVDLVLAFPAVADLLPPERRRPADIPADESRFRLIAALSAILARFASRTALLLLVFDDLQWADLFSLMILESLATSLLEHHRIVIVGTYRSEELDRARSRMLRAVATESIDLARLRARDMNTMIGDILALGTPPAGLVGLLARESEGNPFFIAEYLRVAVEEGWLSRDELGTWRMASKGSDALSREEQLATPPSLAEVLGRRLAGLGPTASKMCSLAAVAGRELDVDLIRTALGATQDELLDALNVLLARQVLETDGPDRVRFVHDKLREAAYARIDRGSLPGHHRTVALALEAYTVGSRGRFDAQLAHHWRVAENAAKEAPYRLAAGDQAFRVGAYHEAIQHLERALALLPETTAPAETARIERQVAEALFGVGDMPSSRRRLASAAEHAGLPPPATPAGHVGTIAADIVASIAANLARPLFRPAFRRRSAEMGEAARAYERLAHVLFFENETLGVASSSLRALRAASQLGPSPELARILGNLSISAALIPFHPLARYLGGHARRIAVQIADEPALAWVTQLDGVYRAGLGQWEPAVASLESALADWHRIGHRRRWEECFTLLGMAAYQAGDRERAARLRGELRAAGAASRSPQTIGWALIGLAEDSLARGQPAAAREQLREALDLGPAIRRVEEIWARGLLARAHLGEGEPESARTEAELALTLAAGTVPTAFYTIEGYAGIAEVLLAVLTDPRVPAVAAAGRSARLSVRALRRFARVFPIAAPRAAACRRALAAISVHGR